MSTKSIHRLDPTLLAVCGGALSAGFALFPLNLSIISFLITYFSALPLFFIGLCWGFRRLIIGTAVAFGIFTIGSGLHEGFVFVLTTLVPTLLIVYRFQKGDPAGHIVSWITGLAIVMFLAACHAAQAPGAFLYFSNGQAIASGVQAVTTTIDGVAGTANAPVARGDAGGSYNAGLIIFYDPKGAPPTSRFTGSIDSSSGNAKSAANISTSNLAVSGLYLSALSWINAGAIPPSALTAMNVANPSTIMVI